MNKKNWLPTCRRQSCHSSSSTAVGVAADKPQVNFKLNKVSFFGTLPPPSPFLTCMSPWPCLSTHLISSLISNLSDRLGFHVDVPQKAFKKFLITLNLKQLIDASLGPLPLFQTYSPPPLSTPAGHGKPALIKKEFTVGVGDGNRVCECVHCERGQFLFPPSSAKHSVFC